MKQAASNYSFFPPANLQIFLPAIRHFHKRISDSALLQTQLRGQTLRNSHDVKGQLKSASTSAQIHIPRSSLTPPSFDVHSFRKEGRICSCLWLRGETSQFDLNKIAYRLSQDVATLATRKSSSRTSLLFRAHLLRAWFNIKKYCALALIFISV